MIIITKNVKSEAYIQFQKSMISTSFSLMLVAECFYVLTVLMFKITLGSFFLRITVKPWQRQVAYMTMAVSTVYSIAYFLFVVFQCGLPKGGWEFLMRKITEKCASRTTWLALSYTHAAIVSLTDVVFAILPMLLLRDSQMRLREKFIVGLVLMLGTR